MVYLFLANGFEEVEALTPVDYLRRAGISVTTVGVGGDHITGAHGIVVKADITEAEAASADMEDIEMVILPGGMPGTTNLDASAEVHRFIAAASGSAHLAAICAAPSIYGKLGLLGGKNAVCYPGFEKYLEGATMVNAGVVTDGNITTARAAGSAADFAFELIRVIRGEEAAEKVRAAVIA